MQRPRIAVYMDGVDAVDETQWPKQHAWILPRLDRFRTTFAGRVKALPFGLKTEAGNGQEDLDE